MMKEDIYFMSLTPARQRRAREYKAIYAFYIANIKEGVDSKTVIKACVNKFGHSEATIYKIIVDKGEIVKKPKAKAK